jgi:hypothetical protein
MTVILKKFDEYRIRTSVHRINTDVEVVTDEHAHEVKLNYYSLRRTIFYID